MGESEKAALRVGVAGATGALGSEVLRVLDKAPWRPKTVVPMASSRTHVPSVEYGDARVTVEDLQFEELGDLDALVVALPAEPARAVVERAIADGVPVVDCSSAIAGMPLVIPWVNPEILGDRATRGVVVPGPVVVLVASALGPLRRAGIDGEVDVTVLLPASMEGRAGIDELSKQVVTLFNAGSPPRKIYEGGLAFDLIPQLGAVHEGGWTERERLASEQIKQITGWEGEVRVTLVQVPLFSGISATVAIRGARRVLPELVIRILDDGGVRVGDAKIPPRPRRVEGKAFVHAGRVRTGPTGEGLHLWLTMDNLRTCAAAAVGAAGALVRR